MPVAIMRLSEDLRLLHTARSGSWYTEYTTWIQHGKELKLRKIFPIKFPFMAILILYSLRNFLAFGINNKITLFFAFWTIGWSLDSPFANWRLPIVRHYCPNWSQICCRWNQALFYYRERFCALTPKFLRNAPTISHPGKCCHIWTNILFFFFLAFYTKLQGEATLKCYIQILITITYSYGSGFGAFAVVTYHHRGWLPDWAFNQ